MEIFPFGNGISKFQKNFPVGKIEREGKVRKPPREIRIKLLVWTSGKPEEPRWMSSTAVAVPMCSVHLQHGLQQEAPPGPGTKSHWVNQKGRKGKKVSRPCCVCSRCRAATQLFLFPCCPDLIPCWRESREQRCACQEPARSGSWGKMKGSLAEREKQMCGALSAASRYSTYPKGPDK